VRFRLDHVVIAVGDLEKTIADYRTLGFNVQVGGEHAPPRTSHNALVVFEDGTYLELIAWRAPMPGDRWFDARAAHGDGLVDFALLPEDAARAVEEAKPRGLALAGPEDGGRLRPDGAELKWQLARPPSFDLPFLCGDLTPRDLRVPPGAARRHANGALGIATLAVAVADERASLEKYVALVGTDSAQVTPAITLPGAGLRICALTLGTSTLLLMAPRESALPRSSLGREVRERLERRGEGPCALALAAGPGHGGGVLDPRLTHGVLMEISRS
jgi:catechol 2,3-dioxygenase-like lactoylglutathione lyase family enzyme